MHPAAEKYVAKIRNKLHGLIVRRRFTSRIQVRSRRDVVVLGSDYGGWAIPDRFLNRDSVCYLAGVGTDVSFDVALLERYGCPLYALDPTPRVRTFVEETIHDSRYHFLPVGLSDTDSTEVFYAPDTPTGVSLRAYGDEVAGELPVRSVTSLMQEFNHDHVDLLKICCEGFEVKILAAVLGASDPLPGVLCVEFARNINTPYDSYRQLVEAGYRLVHTHLPAGNDWKLTFVHSSVPDAVGH
jgi:FkbM family methyltransferase